ncbi:MAG: ABC transporter permease [Bacteroidetes bacterium]|nr:MAG: ABC transporter permease [Bacteroidota bacterium]
MFGNYFKTTWRNLLKNKTSFVINISGLAVGIAVTMLIGMWIWDEISFNKDNKNFNRIASVMQNIHQNGKIDTWDGLPLPLAEDLRTKFKDDFKAVTILNWANSVLAYRNKSFSQKGLYVESQAPAMLDLKMLKGTLDGLKEPDAIFLSESSARAIFGNDDPINKMITVENIPAKVSGIYKDMPFNSTFADQQFITTWELKTKIVPYLKQMDNPWGRNFLQVLVQLTEGADLKSASSKIKDEKLNNVRNGERIAKPELFLQPMSKWHLYSEFDNGVNTGGRIKYVWWFGIIGAFILLLACINFMNLSTAQSQKRAKEVGVRKAVGSARGQLIRQFLGESIIISLVSFFVSIFIVQLSLSSFNLIAGKSITLPLARPAFWIISMCFVFFTGLVAGSYPAFYLSSFKPVKVLKGVFVAGRFSTLPRKVLVVLQFTVSVMLIIGTVVIFRQILFAKNRPVGYNSNGIVTVKMHMYDLRSHFDAIRNDLKSTGAVDEIAESGTPLTAVYNSNGGMSWKGKPPGTSNDFPMNSVSVDFGKVIGWKVVEGRDFSRAFPSDSAAFILNESCVRYMGFSNPIGEKISFNDGVAFNVVGVVKDFIMESPYEPVRPSLFRIVRGNNGGLLNIKINASVSSHEALSKIENVMKKYNPRQPFEYEFANEEYAKKFGDEERIGNLASVFTVLAIFISCLGLFALASFVAEQRTKEIAVRKVLGATVFNLWKLLSKDFVSLVLISLLIASPIAYYFMSNWLMNYQYRTDLPWWIFVAAGGGALLITIITVSFQSVKAAIARPAKSLRSE